MEKEMRGYKAHCLVVPFPVQGHMIPMFQFSKRLEHRGIKITLATTQFIFKTIHKGSDGSIKFDTISDGCDEGGIDQAENFGAYLKRFERVGSLTLTTLVDNLRGLGCPVDCIVYDAFIPWVLDVAKNFGLVGAVFFTQSCVVDNIYYHAYKGSLELPLLGPKVSLPELPPLEPSDMPSFIYDHGSYPTLFEMIKNQFSNVEKVDWILCNTFYKLEEEAVDWMAKLGPFRTIGPTIPSMLLDKRLQEDKDYGFNLFEPKTVASMKWLDEKPNNSVIYVSFGSLAVLDIEQMEELAWGLRGSKKNFLWVVRKKEENKLPKNFIEDTSEKGLVVSWCPQLQVLAHKAIGCFLTHCGWNSTLEALSLGVPMVGMPQWADQCTNVKYVKDVWGIGLRARSDETGVVRKEVVENCIREVMEGDKGKEMRRNSTKWKELAREAVDEGGSSDRNIDEFIAKLMKSS